MEIRREVFDDLIAMAEAGLASPATLELIEECRTRHPEWAASQARSPVLPAVSAPVAVERESLGRTQRLLTLRSWFLCFGIFLCLSPMAFVVRGSEVAFLLRRDRPGVAAALYVAGLLCWAGFVWTSRRLTAAGLARGNERATRLSWMFGAMGIFLPAAITISEWTGQREPLSSLAAMAFVGFAAALWAGRVTRYGR
jgi:drug/metabolite transporter (DMT)-like permease